jgi:hypothetical protein
MSVIDSTLDELVAHDGITGATFVTGGKVGAARYMGGKSPKIEAAGWLETLALPADVNEVELTFATDRIIIKRIGEALLLVWISSSASLAMIKMHIDIASSALTEAMKDKGIFGGLFKRG